VGTAFGERFPYNRRMRILLLNQYFPPDTSATAKMAQAVVEALSPQHQVTVLCGRPSYDPTERRPWRLWQGEQLGNVGVLRVGSTAHPRFRLTARVSNYLSYVALAIPAALFVHSDVVLAMTDPPFAGIVGAMVALLKGKPYVYNIRDMYPDMAVGGSIVEPGWLSRVWERMHRWALRRATRVIVLGEDMRARIVAKGVNGSRVAVVRDGADLRQANVAPQLDADVIRAIRGDFKFVVLHAGNLGFYGAWDTLLEAARLLANDGIGFVFVGDGAERARLQAASSGSCNVRFLDFFPASHIPSVLAAPDLHVITIKEGLDGVVVPSKMYGILAAGKPIVAVAPASTDAVALGGKHGFSRGASPQDAAGLAALLRQLCRAPDEVEAMGRAARAAAADFDRAIELRKFAQVVEQARQA
jgi:putative colanic acid biosynthesis glycosyltransferase WcaI